MNMSLNQVGRWVSSRYIGPVAMSLALMVLVVSELGFYRLMAIGDDREASVDLQMTVGGMRSALLAMESAERGYMLTGRLDYLGRSSSRSGSKGTPAYPAADTIRPQLGSAPWTAVLTSGLSAIDRAIRRASSRLPQPLTSIRITWVAPSPSSAISRARAARAVAVAAAASWGP